MLLFDYCDKKITIYNIWYARIVLTKIHLLLTQERILMDQLFVDEEIVRNAKKDLLP